MKEFKKGDVLGYLGTTGNAIGSHVHISAKEMFKELGYEQRVNDLRGDE